MPTSRRAALIVCLVLAAVPAKTQTIGSETDALKTGLLQVVSIASLGMLTVRPEAASVTRDGADYQVRMPLAGMAAPPDAAITAVARPAERGRFDIPSITFPSSWTLETILTNGTPSRIAFTIGKQSSSARIDPTPAAESSYNADFGNVRLQTFQADQQADQTIDRFASDGTIAALPGGRISFSTQSRGSGFHMLGHGAAGVSSDTSARAMAGHFSVDGLDRVQGTRLLAAARALIAGAPVARPSGPGQPAEAPAFAASPAQRRQLRAAVDAAPGLLNRIEVDETIQNVRFRVVTGTGPAEATVGDLRVSMIGSAVQDRLNARLGISADAIATPNVPVGTAELMPHHIDLKAVLAGIRIGPLIALLRAATDVRPNSGQLQAQAIALLDDPGARIGVEALSFDFGPLAVTGSARLRPRANAGLGGEIHIAARGVDAFLAQLPSQPALQQALPMIFLVKGIARTQGDSLVWDINLGDGPLTVNGIPFGQP